MLAAGASLSSFLIGCEPDEDFNDILAKKENPFESYIPDVNEPPYFDREYYVEEDTSTNGRVGAYNRATGKIYSIFLEDKNHNLINGLEATFYDEEKFGEKIFFITDPQRRYIPNLISFREQSPHFLTMFHKNDVFMGLKNEKGFGDFIIQAFDIDLPSWQIEKANDMPGYFYIGDWSFEDLKDLNTILKYGSLVISVLFPNPLTAAVYSVLNTTGSIINSADDLIDAANFAGANSNINFNFDKEKTYSIYISPSEKQHLFLFPSYYRNAKSSEDIKNLFPLQIGNSLEFTDGYGSYSLTVKGTKSVKGKDLISIVHADGTEEYFGFQNSKLRYYGLNHSVVGNIFFEPALVVGDSNVSIGKEYNGSSKIISEKYPKISGTLRENFYCEYRENLIVPAGPFGDCFKFKEYAKINLKNKDTGETFSDEGSFNHWYAKNIGKIRQEGGGSAYELVDAHVNGLSKKKSGLKSTNSSAIFLNPLSQKIVHAYKSLI